jgi:hypothetical protein
VKWIRQKEDRVSDRRCDYAPRCYLTTTVDLPCVSPILQLNRKYKRLPGIPPRLDAMNPAGCRGKR